MKNTTLQSINSLKNKPGVVVIEGHVQGLANTRLLGQAGIPVIKSPKIGKKLFFSPKNNCCFIY